MSNKHLENKVAIITGAGGGIGRATAILLGQTGATVVVADINALTGEETVDLMLEQGNNAFYVNVNLAKSESCAAMIEMVVAKYGRLDILVNNAAIMHHNDGEVVMLEEKVWDTTMAVNAKGVFLASKFALPKMLDNGSGVILNIASFVALRGSAHATMAYAASKAAILSLTQDIAAKYGPLGIRCLSVSPGPTLTESFEKFINANSELKDNYLTAIPLGRFATVEQIAKNIVHLVSDDASYIHGTNVVIDGGITVTY